MNRGNYWWLSLAVLRCERGGASGCFISRGDRISGGRTDSRVSGSLPPYT